MKNQIYKYSAPLEQFAVWRGAFTQEEIEKINFLEELQQFQHGQVGTDSDGKTVKDIRDSDISWLHLDQNSQWIFDRFSQIIPKVNYDHFMLDVDGFETLQYTRYKLNQHYTWHMDYSFGWQNYVRKISVVMLLSSPEEYEGGEFEICTDGNLDDIKSLKPEAGDIIFFASWMPHRVKPVTSGSRKSVVAWVMGKREC